MKDDFCLKTRAWWCRINSSEIYSDEPPCPLTLHCQAKTSEIQWLPASPLQLKAMPHQSRYCTDEELV